VVGPSPSPSPSPSARPSSRFTTRWIGNGCCCSNCYGHPYVSFPLYDRRISSSEPQRPPCQPALPACCPGALLAKNGSGRHYAWGATPYSVRRTPKGIQMQERRMSWSQPCLSFPRSMGARPGPYPSPASTSYIHYIPLSRRGAGRSEG
jgi:hypothetical protein